MEAVVPSTTLEAASKELLESSAILQYAPSMEDDTAGHACRKIHASLLLMDCKENKQACAFICYQYARGYREAKNACAFKCYQYARGYREAKNACGHWGDSGFRFKCTESNTDHGVSIKLRCLEITQIQ